jgi:hypothetical protein
MPGAHILLSSRQGRRSSTPRKASTTDGSNWCPLSRRSSAIAALDGLAGPSLLDAG